MQQIEPILLGGQALSRPDVLDIRSPWDGSIAGKVCQADAADADRACVLAQEAFTETRRLSSWKRAEILRRIAERLTVEATELAQIIVREAGKPITDALGEVSRAAQTFRVAAEEAQRIGGEVTPADLTPGAEGMTALSRRFAIGPILGITPFNFPVNLVAHKLAPAIASGNPILIKPAPQTPMTSLWLGRAAVEAGWPAAALSVLPCSNEVTAQLVADPRIAMLSFTGSAAVGWMLRRNAATPRVTLELGGNAAVIVCEDADLLKAITRILSGGYTNAGQSCISVQRVFVHASLKDQFVAGLAAGVKTLTAGDPSQAATRVGPMINESAATRAQSWIDEAVSAGATLHAGGKRKGTLLLPALLSDVPFTANLHCEEVFAPVVVVESFVDLKDVIAVVNQSKYGLQAALFTRNWAHMTMAWNELEVGAILIDEASSWRADHLPYGGVKNSGIGKEGVRSAILEMTEARLLILPTHAA